MVEDNLTLTAEKSVKEKNYIEIVVRQFKPVIFGILSCVSLILAALEIVSGIFFTFSLTFLMLTIITIVTGQKRNVKRIKFDSNQK